MPLKLDGKYNFSAPTDTLVLELKEASQEFVFTGITKKPVPSLLRNFSAPINLEFDYRDEELAFLLAHDSDAFNRWEAGQRLATRRLLTLINQQAVGPDLSYEITDQDQLYFEALRQLLNDANLDPAFKELALTLPSEGMLAEYVSVIDPHCIH